MGTIRGTMAAQVLPALGTCTELDVKEDTEHEDPKAAPPQMSTCGVIRVKSDTSAEGTVSAGNSYCLCCDWLIWRVIRNTFRSLPIASTLWFLVYLVSAIVFTNGVESLGTTFSGAWPEKLVTAIRFYEATIHVAAISMLVLAVFSTGCAALQNLSNSVAHERWLHIMLSC